jgi:hypothetical protein
VDEGIDGQMSVARNNYGFYFAIAADSAAPATRVILQKENLKRLIEVLQAELNSRTTVDDDGRLIDQDGYYVSPTGFSGDIARTK